MTFLLGFSMKILRFLSREQKQRSRLSEGVLSDNFSLDGIQSTNAHEFALIIRVTSCSFVEKKASQSEGPLRGDSPYVKSGSDLLSHTVARVVPSARKGLTAEFGMGSGVTPSL